MRAPLSWIRDFTPLDAPVDEIVAALNQVGLEVEAVDEPGREVLGVRAARVVDVAPHPNADLRLADVDTGDTTIRVVCGAPNVRPGMLAAFAPVGATLPGGVTLERRTIRGETSDGMLCSAAELGLGDDHDGILDLAPDVSLGTDVREVLGLDDVIFDLAITPNRPDAMCIVGVARELAAHFQVPLRVPDPAAPTSDVERPIGVVIEAPDRCPRYLARVAEVTAGESPTWLRQRLFKAGMRPISNVVDVTNYVLLERNQPLHAFDVDRLAGPGIVVRVAEPGERLTTLDGVERQLEPEDLLICDADRSPQAIAGIMGGGDSEVSDTTTGILLESAYFERMGIARSSKRLKLRSEASARFERGTDPDGVPAGAERALELLAQVASARVAPRGVDEYPRPIPRPRIRLRTSRVNAILGTALADTEVLDVLRPLGIDVESAGDEIVAVPPSFRPDVDREIDLIEEVARRTGFDAIGRGIARPTEQIGALSRRQRERRLVVDALVGAGGAEVVAIPLVAPDALAPFDVGPAVELANPLRSDELTLRTTLVPGLLAVAAANAARGRPDVALFELGTVFGPPPAGAKLPTERLHLAGLLTGSVHRRPVEVDRPVDGYDALDWLRAVLDALEIAGWALEPTAVPGYHPTRAARLRVDGHDVGTVGELASATATSADAPTPAVAFEADLDQLLDASRRDRSFRELSPFPPSTIDLAFVVPEILPAAAIVDSLRAAGGDLLEDVHPFDEYRGEQLGPDAKSVALTLTFRAADHTLTDAEVATLRTRSIERVTSDHDATLRE